MNKILNVILGLYVFSIPLDFLSGRYLLGVGLSTLISILIVPLWLWQLLITKKIYVPKDVILLLILIWVGLFFLIISLNTSDIGRIFTFVYYVIILLAIINLIKNNNINISILIKSAYFGVITMSLYLLLEGDLGYGNLRLTTEERDLNPNVASGFVLIAIGMIPLLYKKSKIFIIYLLLGIVLFITLFLLQSKTSFISIIISTCVVILLKRITHNKKGIRLNIKKTIRNFSITLVLFILGTLFMNKIFTLFDTDVTTFNRVTTLFSGDLSSATTGRSGIWENAINHGNPFIGTGLFTFRDLFIRPAHNLYVSTFIESGVMGLIIIILYFFILALMISKTKNYSLYFYSGVFILTNLFLFGFGNDVMEYKFYWEGIIIIHAIYIYTLRDTTKTNEVKTLNY